VCHLTVVRSGMCRQTSVEVPNVKTRQVHAVHAVHGVSQSGERMNEVRETYPNSRFRTCFAKAAKNVNEGDHLHVAKNSRL
jgi:hypothetical protein